MSTLSLSSTGCVLVEYIILAKAPFSTNSLWCAPESVARNTDLPASSWPVIWRWTLGRPATGHGAWMYPAAGFGRSGTSSMAMSF